MTGRRFLLPPLSLKVAWRMVVLLIAVAAAHGVFFPHAALAQRPAPSLTGAWNAETDAGNGKTESKLLLKMDGDKLTGTLKTSYGDFPLQDGSVEGADVFFNVVIRRDSYELKTTYRGKVFGDEIQFRVEAGERTLLTIAKKAPAAKEK